MRSLIRFAMGATGSLLLCAAASAQVAVFPEAQILAGDADAGDEFGTDLAFDGDTAVIGAEMDDELAGDAGAAYVFIRTGNTWSQAKKLVASDGAAQDFFGSSVAIEGDTILVGARGDDDLGSGAGSAYVFERSGTEWTEVQKLTASDGALGDAFGISLALSGSTLVIGAWRSNAVGSDAGAAYVFEHAATWTETQRLIPSLGQLTDARFGRSVDIDGDSLVVGAPQQSLFGAEAGLAYVFIRTGPTTWTLQQRFAAGDTGQNNEFGTAVAMSGDTVVVGAYQHGGHGHTYAFVLTTAWTQQQTLFPTSPLQVGDTYGAWIALSGDTAVVGAPGRNTGGAAVVFRRDGATWTEVEELLGADPNGSFGTVALKGDTLLVGADVDDAATTGAGAVYAYRVLPEPVHFCDASDESHLFCPCGNAGDPNAGCDNAQATGGVRIDVANYDPIGHTAQIEGSGFPAATTPTAIVLRAASREPSPIAFGDGLRCIGLPLVRFGATAASGGSSVHAVNHGAGPGTFHYQLWYRSTPASFCDPAAAFNTSNGLTIVWP